MYGQSSNVGLVASGLTGLWAATAWGLAVVAATFMILTLIFLLRPRRKVPRP